MKKKSQKIPFISNGNVTFAKQPFVIDQRLTAMQVQDGYDVEFIQPPLKKLLYRLFVNKSVGLIYVEGLFMFFISPIVLPVPLLIF